MCDVKTSNIEHRTKKVGPEAHLFLDRFLHLAGTDAAGADFNRLHRTILYGPDLLQVGLPDGTGFIVCVTDIISANGLFAADFTFSSHLYYPPESFERALLTRFLC